MSSELRLSGYREPLGLWVRRPTRLEAHPELRARDFEFSSRGDRVPGRLLVPAEGGGSHPVVMLQAGFGGSAFSDAAAATGAPWAGRGVAVASLDLPLQGGRADRKLLARLSDVGPGDGDPLRAALAFEFARQSVIDLERSLDALAELEWIDAERIVYVGVGLGAVVGAVFCALDARPRAAALVLGGDHLGAALLDPAPHVARIAPRPLLLGSVDERDGRTSRAAVDALCAAAEAAGSPVERLELESRGAEAAGPDLPGAALEVVRDFAARQLGLAPPSRTASPQSRSAP